MAMAVDSCAMSCESVNTSLITMTAAVGDVSSEGESFCRNNRDSQPIQAYQQDHLPNKTVVKFDFAFRFPKLQTKNERKKNNLITTATDTAMHHNAVAVSFAKAREQKRMPNLLES
jgi:hypothetical protein